MVLAPVPPRAPVMVTTRPPCTPSTPVRRSDQRAEIARHHVAHQRLIEIFQHAQAMGDLAVEIEVLAIADHQHADIRLDHVGQFAQSR